MREIEEIRCSCGGIGIEAEQTPEEMKNFNCPRGCCGFALECSECHTRFVVRIEAPEFGW